jgi:CcmD family protein
MSTLTWLFIAFMAVWVGLGAYLWSIAIRQRSLERRLDGIARHEPPPSHSD